MAWYDGICQTVGESLASVGEQCMDAGLEVWKKSAELVVDYCTQDPARMGAWSVIKNTYDAFLGIGASLMVLYFVMGWLRESIDIRNSFTLENMFRFFIRLSLTASFMSNGLTLIKEIMHLSALLAAEIGAAITADYSAAGIFEALTSSAEGPEYLGVGILCMLGGFIGMLIIMVSGITILLSVLGRFFKVFICIPFAPIALSSFAGGQGLSQSGISWIKTFLGYCLEVVVITLSLVIAFKLFNGRTFFGTADGWTGVVLSICEICMPLVTAVACVKGAEPIVRKCLGL